MVTRKTQTSKTEPAAAPRSTKTPAKAVAKTTTTKTPAKASGKTSTKPASKTGQGRKTGARKTTTTRSQAKPIGTANELTARALELWKARVPLRKAAEQLGLASADEVRDAALVELRSRPDASPAEINQLELEILDSLATALWGNARRGDTESVDRLLAIQKQRLRLKYAPTEEAGMVEQGVSKTIAAKLAGGDLDEILDAAIIAQAHSLAACIDTTTQLGDREETAKIMYLHPHLLGVLREMEATPLARSKAESKKTDKEARGTLAILQDEKAARES